MRWLDRVAGPVSRYVYHSDLLSVPALGRGSVASWLVAGSVAGFILEPKPQYLSRVVSSSSTLQS